MKEISSYLERPSTRREILKSGLNFGLVGAGGFTAIGASLRERGNLVESGGEKTYVSEALSGKEKAKRIALAALGVGGLFKGLTNFIKEEELKRDITLSQFAEYLQAEGVREISITPVHEEEKGYESSCGTGFAGGSGYSYRIGEAYYTVYEAVSAKGKEIILKQKNDLVKEDIDSSVHRVAVLKNALTAEERAQMIEEIAPSLKVELSRGGGVRENIQEAKRTGLTAYSMLVKE